MDATEEIATSAPFQIWWSCGPKSWQVTVLMRGSGEWVSMGVSTNRTKAWKIPTNRWSYWCLVGFGRLVFLFQPGLANETRKQDETSLSKVLTSRWPWWTVQADDAVHADSRLLRLYCAIHSSPIKRYPVKWQSLSRESYDPIKFRDLRFPKKPMWCGSREEPQHQWSMIDTKQ